MFRQLRKPNDISPEGVFTITVGKASKITAAKWHVLEPADVIETIGQLAETAETAKEKI
jgi:trehalose 6-phosphate synthase/phosphatase